ncbi:unnamed protein product, partial [Allacma fusca]
IVNGIGTAGILIVISELIWFSTVPDPSNEELVNSVAPNEIPGDKMQNIFSFIILFVLLFTVGGGFVMAIILLKGTYNVSA